MTNTLIRFDSTAVRARGDGAEIAGNVTIRGVTRPVTLAAMIYRPQGSEPGARDRLSILLTGSVSRSAFGAAGWAGTVGDEVRLRTEPEKLDYLREGQPIFVYVTTPAESVYTLRM